MKLKIHKGDTVQIIAGADKGKKGKVLQVDSKAMKIKVEGVKIMTHYDKKEGMKKLEGFFDYSNVSFVEKAASEKKKAAKKKSATK